MPTPGQLNTSGEFRTPSICSFCYHHHHDNIISYIVIIFVCCRPVVLRFLLFCSTDGPKIQRICDHKRVDLDFHGENHRRRKDDNVSIEGGARIETQRTRAAKLGSIRWRSRSKIASTLFSLRMIDCIPGVQRIKTFQGLHDPSGFVNFAGIFKIRKRPDSDCITVYKLTCVGMV